MGALNVGGRAGELRDLVDQKTGVAGLQPEQAGLGKYERRDAVDVDQHRPEILLDPEGLPDRSGQDNDAADRFRRRAGLAGFDQRLAQPDGIILDPGVDQGPLRRKLCAHSFRDRLRQAGHVLRPEVPFPAQSAFGLGRFRYLLHWTADQPGTLGLQQNIKDPELLPALRLQGPAVERVHGLQRQFGQVDPAGLQGKIPGEERVERIAAPVQCRGQVDQFAEIFRAVEHEFQEMHVGRIQVDQPVPRTPVRRQPGHDLGRLEIVPDQACALAQRNVAQVRITMVDPGVIQTAQLDAVIIKELAVSAPETAGQPDVPGSPYILEDLPVMFEQDMP